MLNRRSLSAIVALMLSAQIHAQTPAFEVASVKPSNPNSGFGAGGVAPPAAGAPPPLAAPSPGAKGPGIAAGRPTFQVEHRRFTASNFTVFALMVQAYDIKACTGPGQLNCALISGGPGWIRSANFDIDAKSPDNSPDYTMIQYVNGQAPEVRLMLQALLADRFHLRIHREMKQVSAYVLTVGKSGPKLKEAGGEDGLLLWGLSGKPNGDLAVRLTGGKTSMARLADSLASLTGRPVLDQTGLKGGFDFTMEYASDSDAPGSTPFSGPSMFTAFQEQLGLKLDATRAPVEVLVIDSVEKPFAN